MANNFAKDFRETITKMVARHGYAFDADIDTWGDSRGQRNRDAEAHMKVCSVKNMTGYDEEYVWAISDEGNNDRHTGVHGFINCKCGQVEHVSFIVEDASFSTMLRWLLEDDSL